MTDSSFVNSSWPRVPTKKKTRKIKLKKRERRMRRSRGRKKLGFTTSRAVQRNPGPIHNGP